MNDPLPNPWPPTSRSVTGHLAAHAPVFKPHRRTLFVFGIFALLLVVVLSGPSALALLLPWVVIGGLLFYVMRQRSTLRAVQSQVQRAGELTMLRHHGKALAEAWRAVPSLRQWPQFHAQTAMLIGANLLALRCYDAGIAACDYLLKLMPPDHPAGQVLALQRASALLHEERLADADDAMRKAAQQELNPLTAAMLAYAQTYQQVKTHQADQLVGQPEALPQRVRALGYDAGYAYGLVAAAMHERDDHDQAQRWWKLATLLLPASAIMNALPETRVLAALAPAQTLAEAMENDRRG